MVITSKQNPTIKAVANLRRRREREQSGMTLVDGYEELVCVLDAGVRIKTLLYCPELMGSGQQQRLEELLASGADALELSRPVFEKLAYREGPDGWLAVVPAPKADLSALKLGQNPFVLILEAVEKPGNIGAMLRTADAAGVDAVISVDGVTDWGNPNIIRGSKGAVFAVPVAEASVEDTRDWLRQHGVTVIASTPDTSMLYTEPDLTNGVAITVGSEKYGHSSVWLKNADATVRIPMAGKVNSLNVATSAALLMYEVVRQRGAQGI